MGRCMKKVENHCPRVKVWVFTFLFLSGSTSNHFQFCAASICGQNVGIQTKSKSSPDERSELFEIKPRGNFCHEFD